MMLFSSCLIDMTAYATTIGDDVYYNLPINADMEDSADAEYIDTQLSTAGDAELVLDSMYGSYSVEVSLSSNAGETSYTLVNSDAFNIADYSQVEIWVKPGEGSEWIEFSTATSSAKQYEVGEEITRGKWNCITLDLTEIQGALTQGNDLKVTSNDSSVWYFDEVRSIETKVYSFNLSNMIDSKTEISNGGLQFKDNSVTTFDVTPTILTSDELSISGEKEISKITIDRKYADDFGDLSELPVDALYLSDLSTMPMQFVISGSGNKLYYVDPLDAKKIYKLDLITGTSTLISVSYAVEEMKVSNEGDYLAIMTNYDTRLYRYAEVTSSVILIDSDVHDDYDIQNNGDILYYETNEDDFYVHDGSSKNSIYSYTLSVESLHTNGDDEIIYFYYEDGDPDDEDYIYKLENTLDHGWERSTVYGDFKDLEGLHVSDDGNCIYARNDGDWYMYSVKDETLRKIPISYNDTIFGSADDDRLMVKDFYERYYLYDADVGDKEAILMNDVNYYSEEPHVNASFAKSGDYIAYVAGDTNGNESGIKVKHIGEIKEPERYLLSFDGNQSWYSYHKGAWTKVSDSSTPSEEVLVEYGMTASEVNNLDKGEYTKLYEEFSNIYSVSIASYFASVDCFTTPSIKSIKVIACNDVDDFDRFKTKSNLYAAKKKDFDGTDWRKIKKIYPLEIAQQSADFQYFIYIDSAYRVYKDGSWQTVSNAATYLSDVETNWIDITLEGMTAEELRNIPESDLTTELAGESFSIVYALKVCDESTEEYSSMINIDYTENLFTITGMTLSVTLYGNTTPVQYTNLTDTQVEDFMEWIHSRQYNYGPIFYRIDNGTTSEFINYFMIQKVSVED